jgi:hypothetical protein
MCRRILAVAVVGLALGGVGWGCGDGSLTALSKAEFIKRGNEICKLARERKAASVFGYRERHQEDAPAQASDRRLVTAVALAPIQRMNEELLSLAPPSRDAGQVAAIVHAFEAAAMDQERNPAGVLEGARDPFYRANRMASRYGLNVCAEV